MFATGGIVNPHGRADVGRVWSLAKMHLARAMTGHKYEKYREYRPLTGSRLCITNPRAVYSTGLAAQFGLCCNSEYEHRMLLLFHHTIAFKLTQISDDVRTLLFVLNTSKRHLGTGHHFLWRRQPLVQCRIVPGFPGRPPGDKTR